MPRVTCIKIPVAGPVPKDGESVAEAWTALRKELAVALEASTAIANAVMHEIVRRDCVRMPGMTKLPPMKIWDEGVPSQGYHFARSVCRDMPATSANAIFRAVEEKYKAKRFEVIWQRNASHMQFRYPFPFIAPKANVGFRWLPRLPNGADVPKIKSTEDEHKENNACPYLVVTIWSPEGSEVSPRKWCIRLKSGKDYRLQLALFRQIVAGTAKSGEVSFTKRNDGQIFVSIPVTITDTAPTAAEGVLSVRTASTAFLIARTTTSNRLWKHNGDWMRSKIAARWAQRERERQDIKFEHRQKKAQRAAMLAISQQRDDKQRRRLNSFIEMSVAATVSYAKRNRCGTILFDDSDRTFAASFRWFELHQQLKNKCAEFGITLIHKPAFNKEQEAANELLKLMFQLQEDANDDSDSNDDA